ncbi:Pyruvate kinase [Candidatus Filomicrobium marinum]|uniref:Pyruvate kinase n=2 Tax=Filomicrobium TaxID=119044 RepID=A0A0D6JG10_9HYPH|nr:MULTISPECIES: pyruvate kinase [Filomicrobium]MCV0369959.1 pyruvate kinase [Filomicrobium sp.]CFX29289.1 Pyruvate kinase [Candidatus Filomicrobium marinum]CPR19801.1 Pyruvate kinase [Candidatus Filomicrobium marinum]SDO01190.1 pyruvate kinase [Filomicrobium insigne]
MRRNRRVKLVATVGPASSSPQMLEKLFQAGVDVFRINMSHASHELARELHLRIRELSAKHSFPIGILADLQGPKFRLGAFQDERVKLEPGSTFTFLRYESPGKADQVYLPHPQIFEAVEAGHTLLLDDGKLRMRVDKASDDKIVAEVLVGGMLASRKGISLPDTLLPVGPLTDKDRLDLDFALQLGVDWVALSFVQRGVDVEEANEIVAGRASVMVKVEKPQAIDDLNAIIAAADGFMVARGDLGVEMPIEKVPGLQKKITRKARAAGKPVVIATQMLESMISSPVPTRAEVSDVATAVFEGADAVMLSAESAVGKYPVEAIEMMNRIAVEVENDKGYQAILYAWQTEPQPTAADAIAAAAHAIANTVQLAAIVCYTATGSTARRVARERPNLPVIALTPVPETAHQLSVVWGLHSIVLDADPDTTSDMTRKACQIAFSQGFAKPGEGVLITGGVPLGTPGTTNMIRIAYINEDGEPMAKG